MALEPQRELADALAARYPQITVLPVAVGDKPGKAKLRTSSAHTHLATLNDSWRAQSGEPKTTWDDAQAVPVTTLQELSARYGRPAFVKIDTEGYEDRVLAGLTEAIPQLLFEIHSTLPDVARRSFERLGELGHYEYRVMVRESWVFGPPATPQEILASLPPWADVYANRV